MVINMNVYLQEPVLALSASVDHVLYLSLHDQH